MIAGLVLAAGAGRRFGSTKQLADLEGRPLLEHAVAATTAVAALERVLVTLGHDAEAIRARVDLGRAEPLVVPAWDEGQAASLRAGVAALDDADAVVVVLGDQPHVRPAAIERVLAAEGAARATYGGVPGHPVRLPRELFPAVAALRGDEGARRLLADAQSVPCDDLGGGADVDTPDQLSRA